MEGNPFAMIGRSIGREIERQNAVAQARLRLANIRPFLNWVQNSPGPSPEQADQWRANVTEVITCANLTKAEEEAIRIALQLDEANVFWLLNRASTAGQRAAAVRITHALESHFAN